MSGWRAKLRIYLAAQQQKRSWVRYAKSHPIPDEVFKRWAENADKLEAMDLAEFRKEIES